jgi:hypothetical protein
VQSNVSEQLAYQPIGVIRLDRTPASLSRKITGEGFIPDQLACQPMVHVTLRDLQMRRRRFVITDAGMGCSGPAIVGTNLVFPLTPLLTKIHCCGGRRPRMFARSKSKQFGGPVALWVPARR